MNGSQILKFATWGVACPLALLFLLVLRTGSGGVERAVLIGFCLAPTAVTYHFALWLERVERTVRIRFLPPDPGVVLATRIGIACSLLALTWAFVSSLATPLSGAYDLRTLALVLGPVMASLFLGSLSIGAAVERVVALAESA